MLALPVAPLDGPYDHRHERKAAHKTAQMRPDIHIVERNNGVNNPDDHNCADRLPRGVIHNILAEERKINVSGVDAVNCAGCAYTDEI